VPAAAPMPSGAAGAVDERSLFIFSSLTQNAHRIHYDAVYAREVEGHRGLLVHGPLTALFAAEAVHRETGREVGEYDSLVASLTAALPGMCVRMLAGIYAEVAQQHLFLEQRAAGPVS
jgi:acyl dehydratase